MGELIDRCMMPERPVLQNYHTAYDVVENAIERTAREEEQGHCNYVDSAKFGMHSQKPLCFESGIRGYGGCAMECCSLWISCGVLRAVDFGNHENPMIAMFTHHIKEVHLMHAQLVVRDEMVMRYQIALQRLRLAAARTYKRLRYRQCELLGCLNPLVEGLQMATRYLKAVKS